MHRISLTSRIHSILSKVSPRSRVRHLIQNTSRTTGIEASVINSWVTRIEAVRKRLAGNETLLEAWDRPWLTRSEELLAKLQIDGTENTRAQMTVRTACSASKPLRECLRLFELVAKVKPETAIEMGTNVGISGMYICAAMEAIAKGRLVTMEGAGPKLSMARHAFAITDLGHRVRFVLGDFDETLPAVVSREKPIDLAFVDGFHDGLATVQYFHTIRNQCSPGATLVFDDVTWSPGMRSAWSEICRSRGVADAYMNGTLGVCVLGDNCDVTPRNHR